MRIQVLLASVFICFLLLFACQKPQEINNILDVSHHEVASVLNMPYELHDYNSWAMPSYLTALGLQKPPLKNTQVTLGRVLFYDKSLSADGKISCASCHNPNAAFADPERFSLGVNGRRTSRNSPALANTVNIGAHYHGFAKNQSPFFWDNRVTTVAQQARETIQNPDEMGMNLDQLVKTVSDKRYYQILFESAYGDKIINEERVMESLEQFVMAIPASNTKFDKGMEIAGLTALTVDSVTTRPDTIRISAAYYQIDTTIIIAGDTTLFLNIPGFTREENIGGAIFVRNCSECHSPIRPFQSIFEANIGLSLNYTDQGKGTLTYLAKDRGVFKAPPLRNIAITAPYMHDGRFATLEQVVEFYSGLIKPHPNLHPLLKNADGTPKQLDLSSTEKLALIAFLNTLTDQTESKDEKFKNPFK